MTDVLVPSSTIPVSGNDLPTVPYYQFFEDVSHAFTLVADEGNLKELDVRVTALENEDTEQTPIEGQMSIAVAPPNLISGTYTVSLKHDSQYPGNTTFYGTSATGDKGWHPAIGLFDDSANITVVADASTGVLKADLTDVATTTGGTLKKRSFDAKGRLSAEDDATTDDLTEGTTNLYFTDERAQDAAVDNAITPGVTNKAPSEDAVSKALANVPTGVPYYVPAGDTFTVPLDKQALFSDPITLDGDLVVDGRLIDVAATAISGVSHTDTSTIAIAGDGTPTSPLSASAKISVVAGNKIITKSDGLFTDAGGIHIDDRVSTYANLPSPPTEGTGATYLVTDGGSYADNLLYVWDGSAWPAEGDGVLVGAQKEPKRWWRIFILSNNGSDVCAAFEIELRATSGGPSLATGGSAFASAEVAGAPADQAFDGNLNTYWSTGSGENPPQWIAYQLSTAAYIVEVTYTGPSTTAIAPKDFVIQSSMSSTNGADGTWRDEWAVTDQTNWTALETRTFTRRA